MNFMVETLLNVSDVFSQGSQPRGSVPSSPVPSQKRAATEMVPPDRTPKRAKTFPSTSSAVSPSIKHWLKRSASDSPTSKDEVKNKKCKFSENESTFITTSAANSEYSLIENSGKACEKTGASSGPMSRTLEAQNQRIVGRISCKRKLDESSGENTCERPNKRLNMHDSPTKDVMKSPEKENSGASSLAVVADISGVKSNKLKSSPTKQSAPFKDLKSDINSSPDKRVQEGHLEFYSPARPSKFDIDAKTLASPTTNLPNSVVDSPTNTKKIINKENEEKKPVVDWLTQIRMQKTRKNTSSKACSRKLSDKYGQSSEPATPSKESQSAAGNSEELLKCKVSIL